MIPLTILIFALLIVFVVDTTQKRRNYLNKESK